MNTIDLNKLKQDAVHTGMLEVVCALKDATNKIWEIKKENELNYDDWPDILTRIAVNIEFHTGELSGLMGHLLELRLDSLLDKENVTTP